MAEPCIKPRARAPNALFTASWLSTASVWSSFSVDISILFFSPMTKYVIVPFSHMKTWALRITCPMSKGWYSGLNDSPPKDMSTSSLGICEYYLIWKKVFTDAVKNLEMRSSCTIQWALNLVTIVLIKKKAEGDLGHTMEVMWPQWQRLEWCGREARCQTMPAAARTRRSKE